MLAAGGLHIVGTERHEARRIDNQLRGRAGRQGDPGSTRFYLSLEDDLMRRFASERVSSIMGRLGFDDDTALESGMVSRTIEGAQTRVEGFNFDTRKHVVEYDDVINRQRETIYHERGRILRAESLSTTVLAMLGEELHDLVTAATSSDYAGDWNRDGLRAQLIAMIPTISEAELQFIDEAIDPGAIEQSLLELIEAHYERKRSEVGEAGMPVLERLVLLRVIDALWVEHLTAVDDMRRGIGLRAYSQRDPLNEFKVEAYRMFDELKATIRHDVTHTIFRVTVVTEPPPPPARRMQESRPDVSVAANGGTSSIRRGRGRRGWRGRDGYRRAAAAGSRRAQGRTQRSMLVWVGQEVQALPRGLNPPAAAGRPSSQMSYDLRTASGGAIDAAREPDHPLQGCTNSSLPAHDLPSGQGRTEPLGWGPARTGHTLIPGVRRHTWRAS